MRFTENSSRFVRRLSTATLKIMTVLGLSVGSGMFQSGAADVISVIILLMSWVFIRLPTKSGCPTANLRNGRVVPTPSIEKRASASSMRSIALARSSAWTISFARVNCSAEARYSPRNNAYRGGQIRPAAGPRRNAARAWTEILTEAQR